MLQNVGYILYLYFWGGLLTCSLDNPENLEGAPCSIQVFTQKMRDEECMEIAKIVDKCLH
jgi:amidase